MKSISSTAYCTCGIRMMDARNSLSISHDYLAHVFMDDQGMAVFKGFQRERLAAQHIAARHRIIDDLLIGKLAENPDTTVISIGSGFETRSFRLPGGTWVEVDEEAIIQRKNEMLEESRCPNPLRRVSIDFNTDSLYEVLKPLVKGQPTIIVMEGVLMYLSETQINDNLSVLQSLFPGHLIIADQMTELFSTRYSRSFDSKINELGASYQVTESPEKLFIKAGYSLDQRYSIPLSAALFIKSRIRYKLLSWFLPSIRHGYEVHVYQS